MDRRSFFTSIGALAATPLAGCVGRDSPAQGGPGFAEQLIAMRQFAVPADIEPALPFKPLRKKR